MSRRAWNYVIIVAAVLIAVANPLVPPFRLKAAAADRHAGPGPQGRRGSAAAGGARRRQRADGRTDQRGQGSRGATASIRRARRSSSITQVGLDRILLQVPGEKNPDSVIEVIGETALLEWINTAGSSFPAGTDFNVPGTTKRAEQYAKYETILTGKDLKHAEVQVGQQRRGPIIAFEFKPDAGDIFGQFTNDHVGQYLTVLLDGKVVTSPVIKGADLGRQRDYRGPVQPGGSGQGRAPAQRRRAARAVDDPFQLRRRPDAGPGQHQPQPARRPDRLYRGADLHGAVLPPARR